MNIEPIADTINRFGERLLTLDLTVPRWMWPQLLTHRRASRNAQSSRAVPFEKMLEAERYTPRFTGGDARLKGMSNGDPVPPALQEWLAERIRKLENETAVALLQMQDQAELHGLHLCRGQLNRYLEPFRFIRGIVTMTVDKPGWLNLVSLRTGPGPQSETREVGERVEEIIWSSEPTPSPLHIPFDPGRGTLEERVSQSVARCARISFLLVSALRSSEAKKKSAKLREDRHWSPFEHQAFTSPRSTRPTIYETGNFVGTHWCQLRKLYDRDTNYLPADESFFPEELR